MEVLKGNEHLIPKPEGFKPGDLIEVTVVTPNKRTSYLATVKRLMFFEDNPEELNKLVVLPKGSKEPLNVFPTSCCVVSRPINITNVSSEDLTTQLERIRKLQYNPIPEGRKRKARASTVRKKASGKKEMVDRVEEGLATGKISTKTVDVLNDLLEKAKKGEL